MGEWERPPKLRDDLIVSEQETGGQKYIIVKDPVTFRYFRLREPEYFILRQFDGQTDGDTIARRLSETFGLTVSVGAIEQFAARVDELYFFEGSKAEYEISSGRYLRQTRKSLWSKILFIKIKAFNPQRLLDFLAGLFRFAFNPIAIVLTMFLIFFGFLTYSANFEYFRFDPQRLYSVVSIIIVILSLAAIILLHEFAHAVTCRYHGGQVREMGFLLLYFQPCFYSNLSDSWMFKSKSQRLAVLWAGLFFQMALFAVAVFGWRITVIGTGVNNFFWITANVCLVALLFNINPLIKLDGYYFLSEWVDIPNLRQKSFDYLKRTTRRLMGIEATQTDLPRRERRIYFRYMILAGIYSALLIILVIFLAYRFLVDNLRGWGFVLFLILTAVIFKAPVVQGVRFVGSREVMKAFRTKPRNSIIGGIAVVAIVIIVFIIPFPRQVGGDIVVRPIAEYTITMLAGQGRLELNLREGGLVREYSTEHIQISSGDLSVLRLTPMVKEGDAIKKGDTLAAMISNEVSSNLDAARSQLERLRGELALAQSPPKPEEIATAQAAVNAAQATVTQLENDVTRNLSLFDKKLISRQELENSQSDMNVAKSNLEESEARLRLLKSPPKQEQVEIIKSQIATQEANIAYFVSQEAAQVITSPIGGMVTALYRNDLLFKISDMSQVEAAIPVTDNYLEFVAPDAEVHTRVRTFPDRVFAGKVAYIASSADGAEYEDNRARFSVHAILDNSEMALRDGMSGYAKISCGTASLFGIAWERVKSFIRVEFWSWW